MERMRGHGQRVCFERRFPFDLLIITISGIAVTISGMYMAMTMAMYSSKIVHFLCLDMACEQCQNCVTLTEMDGSLGGEAHDKLHHG